jgi:hypothetical protein
MQNGFLYLLGPLSMSQQSPASLKVAIFILCLLLPIWLGACGALIWVSFSPEVHTTNQLAPVKGVVTSFSIQRTGKSRKYGMHLAISGYGGTFNARIENPDYVRSLVKAGETLIATSVRKEELLDRREGMSSRLYGLTLDEKEIQSAEDDIRYFSVAIAARVFFAALGAVLMALGFLAIAYQVKAYKHAVAIARLPSVSPISDSTSQ